MVLLLWVLLLVAWAEAPAQGGGGHGTPPPSKKTRTDKRDNITETIQGTSQAQP
jgi:hypothetical protein